MSKFLLDYIRGGIIGTLIIGLTTGQFFIGLLVGFFAVYWFKTFVQRKNNP